MNDKCTNYMTNIVLTGIFEELIFVCMVIVCCTQWSSATIRKPRDTLDCHGFTLSYVFLVPYI